MSDKRVIQETDYVKVETGPETVVEVDKLYGPLIACGVRVKLDYHRGEWVIERERIRNGPTGDIITFEEVFRFDCQESIEFDR